MSVVQKTSQLVRRLERSASALISSSKVKPFKESSVNTRLKVLIWEVVGSIFLSLFIPISQSLMLDV